MKQLFQLVHNVLEPEIQNSLADVSQFEAFIQKCLNDSSY